MFSSFYFEQELIIKMVCSTGNISILKSQKCFYTRAVTKKGEKDNTDVSLGPTFRPLDYSVIVTNLFYEIATCLQKYNVYFY